MTVAIDHEARYAQAEKLFQDHYENIKKTNGEIDRKSGEWVRAFEDLGLKRSVPKILDVHQIEEEEVKTTYIGFMKTLMVAENTFNRINEIATSFPSADRAKKETLQTHKREIRLEYYTMKEHLSIAAQYLDRLVKAAQTGSLESAITTWVKSWVNPTPNLDALTKTIVVGMEHLPNGKYENTYGDRSKKTLEVTSTGNVRKEGYCVRTLSDGTVIRVYPDRLETPGPVTLD